MMAFAHSVSSILGALTALIPLGLALTAVPVFLSWRVNVSSVLIWLTFFTFDSLKTELEILEMRERAAAHRREKKSHTFPKKVYMFTEVVTRWQWHTYKWSLRLDWVVTLIYRFAVWRKRTQTSAPSMDACAEKIAAMCLETTMAIYCVEITKGGMARFEYRDWECGLSNAKSLHEALRVECFVVIVDLNTKRAVECWLNGELLESWTEAADIVFWCWGTFTHPLCHCYAILACAPRSDDRIFARMALYAFAMNFESTNCGYLCVGKDYMERRLQYNMRNGVVPHGDGPVLSQLVANSTFIDYCMKARPKVQEVIRAYKLPMCSVGYFQMSVVHSLDHYGSMNYGGKRVIGYSDRFGAVSGLHDFFSDFIFRVTTDTRLSQVKAPWAEELYRHLHEIDADIASRIHYAISF